MNETWAATPGWDGYEASNEGRVRSVPRLCARSDGHPRRLSGKIISPWVDKAGRLNVSIYPGGVRRNVGVHQLVALAFHPKPSGEVEVNHKDGNPRNNRADNLEWTTRQGNIDHAVANGLTASGERHGMAKLRAEQVVEIRRQLAAGVERKAIAAAFGCALRTVHAIRSRKIWATL